MSKLDRDELLADIRPPYWYAADSLPALDFNREIIEPGSDDKFPDGTLVIRADGDFWAVAALPLKYRDHRLADVVKALWPQYADQADFSPDHGSIEQRVYFAEMLAKREKLRADHYWEALKEREAEISRLRRDRPHAHEFQTSRHRAEKDYFVRQYEHLLIAMAHEHEPGEARPGICSKCGLSASDRVHDRHYIERHNQGYEPMMKHLMEFGERDKFGA